MQNETYDCTGICKFLCNEKSIIAPCFRCKMKFIIVRFHVSLQLFVRNARMLSSPKLSRSKKKNDFQNDMKWISFRVESWKSIIIWTYIIINFVSNWKHRMVWDGSCFVWIQTYRTYSTIISISFLFSYLLKNYKDQFLHFYFYYKKKSFIY